MRESKTMNFQPIKKEDKPLFDRYYGGGYYENAHFNFTNLYMWRNPFDICKYEENGVLYLTAKWNGELMALQPVGAPEKMDEAVYNIANYFDEMGEPLLFSGVEKSFTKILEDNPKYNFKIETNKNDYDYVYLAENLIKLAGRKFHSKKNHLNAFRKTYPEAEYLAITDDIVTLCKIELNGWYKKRKENEEEANDPYIGYERAAIIEILNDFSYFNLKGGAIRLNGRIIAFTFGEKLNSDTAVVHVEKADPDVRGAYPAINQAFIENEFSDMTYINREEDMGLEGLSKAKESYHPVKMIEKFSARIV